MYYFQILDEQTVFVQANRNNAGFLAGPRIWPQDAKSISSGLLTRKLRPIPPWRVEPVGDSLYHSPEPVEVQDGEQRVTCQVCIS